MRYVPPASPIMISPASIASPPPPVMNSAWSAAARARGFVSSLPMRRYDVIEVSSQNTNSPIS